MAYTPTIQRYTGADLVLRLPHLVDLITECLNHFELVNAWGSLTLDFDDSIDRMMVRRKALIDNLDKTGCIPSYLGGVSNGLSSQRGTMALFSGEFIDWDEIPTNQLPRDYEDFKRIFGHRIWLLRLPHWFQTYHMSWSDEERLSPMTTVSAMTDGFFNMEILVLHLEFFHTRFYGLEPSILRHIVLPIFHRHPLSTFPLFNLIIIQNTAFFRVDEIGVLIRETTEFTDYLEFEDEPPFRAPEVNDVFLPRH